MKKIVNEPRRAAGVHAGRQAETTQTLALPSPIGTLWLRAEGGRLAEIRFPRRKKQVAAPARVDANSVLHRAARQLREYFAGKRTHFDLPLAAEGTAFQTQVWDALRKIPYGETRNYGEIAAAVGKRGAARAVGGANNKNPIPIVIPCHRVIGADGSLTGFGGGLGLKEKLLAHEQRART